MPHPTSMALICLVLHMEYCALESNRPVDLPQRNFNNFIALHVYAYPLYYHIAASLNVPPGYAMLSRTWTQKRIFAARKKSQVNRL